MSDNIFMPMKQRKAAQQKKYDLHRTMSYRPSGAGSSAVSLEGINLEKTAPKKKGANWLR